MGGVKRQQATDAIGNTRFVHVLHPWRKRITRRGAPVGEHHSVFQQPNHRGDQITYRQYENCDREVIRVADSL
jgi:hypothetical protein